MLAFDSAPTSALFFSTYLLWFVSEFVGAYLIPRFRRSGNLAVKRDRGSAVLIIISVFASITVAFNFGRAGLGPLHDWVFYPGIFMMTLGVVVRQWAIAVLGRFFSLPVRAAEDHRVVGKGLYRLVCHPSHTESC
ncbi:MAG TPA: isoprenylcysteine carboxylmethyltransferase family protein [Candidatus Bathyarchaeia archaeon]|nr:isoprenylcysteine carboxylmethyltransferase family protein [Candidatus Bathyarchaeia archaeon]